MKQKVRILRDFPAVSLVGRQLGPFVAGQEVELEVWEVSVFEKHGFGEAIQKLKLIGLKKLMLEEERKSEPAVLRQDFYTSLLHTISDLRVKEQLEEIEELRSAVAAFSEMRLQKLVRFATSQMPSENLPPEEKFLVNRLAMAIEDWNKWLESLFQKEEVGENGKFGGTLRHAVGSAPDIQKSGVSATDVHAG
jgi:hypothetical protein